MNNLLLVILLTWLCLWLIKKYQHGRMGHIENCNNYNKAKIEPNLPYTKKPYFLSNNERNFLYIIEKITGNKFYIFPQVHYCKIIYAEGQQNFKNPWFNKIDRKSADFVLFDKINVSPLLVIEIDDSSHQRQNRVERDEFINGVLEKCKIPIIHVTPFVSEEELKRQIQDNLFKI